MRASAPAPSTHPLTEVYSAEKMRMTRSQPEASDQKNVDFADSQDTWHRVAAAETHSTFHEYFHELWKWDMLFSAQHGECS